jgi:hypothetical protein
MKKAEHHRFASRERLLAPTVASRLFNDWSCGPYFRSPERGDTRSIRARATQELKVESPESSRGAIPFNFPRHEQLSIALGDKSMHGLICIEEAGPRHPRDFRRK